MQILSTLILQFIFIYLSLIIGVPGADKYNVFKNKLILFCGIFVFEEHKKIKCKQLSHKLNTL